MSQLPFVPNLTGAPSQFGVPRTAQRQGVLRLGARQKPSTNTEFLQRFNPEAPDLIDVFKGSVVDTGRLLTAGIGNLVPGEDIFEEWAADLGALRERHPEWNTRHVESAWQLLSNPGLLLENVVAQAPYMIGAMASYGVGAVLGSAAGLGGLAGKAASFGFTALVEGQSAYEDALSYGATESEAQFAGMLTGSINGLLEVYQMAGLASFGKRMARSAGRAMTRSAFTKLTEMSTKGYVKALSGPLAKELAMQSFQEMLQGTSAETIAYQVYGKPVEEGFLDRRMQEAIGVSASTLLFGAGQRGWDSIRGGKDGFDQAIGISDKPKIDLQVVERAAVERFGMTTSDANRFTYGFLSPVLERFGQQYGIDSADVLDKHLAGFVDAFNDGNVFFQEASNVSGFFSQLEKTLVLPEIQSRKTMPGVELRAFLKKAGVKDEELRWTGIFDELQRQDKINVAELLETVRDNSVSVERMLGRNRTAEEQARHSQLQSLMDKHLDNAYKLREQVRDQEVTLLSKEHREIYPELAAIAQEDVDKARQMMMEKQFPPAFIDTFVNMKGEYQAADKLHQELNSIHEPNVEYEGMQRPYGNSSDYREILIMLPGMEEAETGEKKHYGKRNILVALRGDARQTSDGGKTFFVTEIQSDWAANAEGLKFHSLSDPQLADERFNTKKPGLQFGRFKFQDARLQEAAKVFDGYKESATRANEIIKTIPKEERDAYSPAEKHRLQLFKDALASAVTDAPLLDRYREVAVKAALTYAFQQGYDRVDFIQGETRAPLSGFRPGPTSESTSDQYTGVLYSYDVALPSAIKKVLKQLGGGSLQDGKVGFDEEAAFQAELKKVEAELDEKKPKHRDRLWDVLSTIKVTTGDYFRLYSPLILSVESGFLDETARATREEEFKKALEQVQPDDRDKYIQAREEYKAALDPLLTKFSALWKKQFVTYSKDQIYASRAIQISGNSPDAVALREALSRGVPLFQEESGARREKSADELLYQLQKANPEALQRALFTEAVIPEKPDAVLYQDETRDDPDAEDDAAAGRDVVYPILVTPKSPNIEARPIIWKQIMKRTLVALGSFTHPSTGNRLIASISVEDIPEEQKGEILKVVAEMDALKTTQERYWYGREKLGEATMKKIYRTFGLEKIKESTPDTDLYQEPVKSQANGLRTPPMFGGKRGGVKFLEDGKALVGALENADFSTLVHEFGHIFRRVMADIAKTPNAPGAIQAGQDLATMEAWAGVKDGQWERKHEEKFAKAFEKWVMTGKAPLVELQGHFSKFKSYMERIYLGAMSYFRDVRLSPDIRGVFDRMFSADTAEIAQTREELQQLYEAAEIPDEAILGKISNKAKEQRAYELWEKGGRKDGLEQEYWNAAELELRSEALKEKGAKKSEYKDKLKKLEQLMSGQTLLSNDDNHLPHIQQRMIDYLATSSPQMKWLARAASKVADPIRGLWSMIAPIEKVPSGKVFANILRDMNVEMNMARGQFEEQLVRTIDALSESDKAWLTNTEGSSGIANIVRMIDIRGTPRELRIDPPNPRLLALRNLAMEIQVSMGQAAVDARMMQTYGERDVVPLSPNKYLTLPRVATQELYQIVQSPGGLEHQILVLKIKELNPDLKDTKVIEKALDDLYGSKVKATVAASVRQIRVMPSYIDVPGQGKVPLVRLTPYDLLSKSIEASARRVAMTKHFGVAPLFEGINFDRVVKLGKTAGMSLLPSKEVLLDVLEAEGASNGEFLETLDVKALASMAKNSGDAWQKALKQQLINELQKVDPVKIKGLSRGFSDRTLSYRERFVRPEDTEREEFDGYVNTWAEQRKQFMKLTGFKGEIFMRQTADGPMVDFVWKEEITDEQQANFEEQVRHFINKKFYGELLVGDLVSPSPRSGSTKVPDTAPRKLTKQAKAFELLAREIRGVDPKQDPVFLRKDMLKRLTEPQPDVLGELKNRIVRESKDPAIVERIDNVLRVWEGLPYHQMPRNLFTRTAKAVSNVLGTIQTSLSVIPNTVQTASLVPLYTGVVNYEKAISDIHNDKNITMSEMAALGAFTPAVYQWSLTKGFWLEGIARNIRQAVSEFTGLRAMGELNGLIAAKAHDYLYQQWSQKFTAKDEVVATRLGLSPEDIDALKNKRLSNKLRAKVVQLGTQRTQFVTEATFERGEIENRPFMRMLFAYSNYTMGMMRNTVGLIDEWKQALSSGESFKKTIVPVAFRTFTAVAAAAGVGVAGMLLRNAVKGKLPGEDDDTLLERALAGLTEIQMLGAAQRMMGGFEYAEGNIEKAWIGLMPHAQAVSDLFASVFRLNKFRDFPIGDRMVQYAKRQFPLLAALTGKDATELEWMDFYAFPEQQAYMEATTKVNKWIERQPTVSDYARAGLKERKFYGVGVVNPDFDDVFQAVKRGDVEGARESYKELLYKLRSDKTLDPVQALQNLKRSLVMKAPLTMKESEKQSFLRSLPADDKRKVYQAHARYMRLVNSLIPSAR